MEIFAEGNSFPVEKCALLLAKDNPNFARIGTPTGNRYDPYKWHESLQVFRTERGAELCRERSAAANRDRLSVTDLKRLPWKEVITKTKDTEQDTEHRQPSKRRKKDWQAYQEYREQRYKRIQKVEHAAEATGHFLDLVSDRGDDTVTYRIRSIYSGDYDKTGKFSENDGYFTLAQLEKIFFL